MKILAQMPCYKVMEIPAVQSLVAMQADVFNRGDNLRIAFTSGFNAAMARQAMFMYVDQLEDEFDWVIHLDSDHVYRASDLYALIEKAEENKLDILSATYFCRTTQKKITSHGRFVNGEFQQFKDEELNGSLMDCDVAGLGFFLMRPQVIKHMVKKYRRKIFAMDADGLGDEAVQFCKLLKDEGYKIKFDPSVRVGHLTTISLR